ncbi:TPA: phage late control D family protein [Mannheimia haemolytica]|uniref:Tail protein D n=3 Tax=root TaxID=1 RepID=A0A0M3LQA4_9CAUD|nr:phage late control D family protein [Mannheimia haemolytica]YP_009207782.1 tail protein [Mannheimia phage vB_MhM_587AP1]YP_009785014.1 tail protein [Mannheimia phage vB_MhM_1127AP1]AJA72953.1 tail protein D [Mannheimia phage vB_MhM_587AP1]AJA73081.1 tail protein D [Mannheimia phage vB_MhM_1127AP1]KYL19024.1 tail protein [Mannheimia haemolytica]KYL20997.1 tail protein [Mannheimia haemolytica]MDW0573268.1 phage late control D family protein [Mannheimia haemolytica]
MDFLAELTNHNHRTPAVSVTVRPKPSKDNEGEKAKDISSLITHRLIQLTLTDNRGFEADQLDLELDDTDGLLALPSRGAILSVGLGWQNSPLTYKGEYTVDELTHDGPPDKVTIRARSADLRGTLTNRHERSFHRTTIGKIVKQIAEENKLKPIVGKEFENEEVKHIDQTNESSINLLQRLAEQFDAIATVKNGNLIFIKAGNATTASGKPLPLFRITRSSGDSHSFSIAEGDNYKAVKAYWHNTQTGKRGEVTWDENSQVKKVTKPTMRKKTKVKRGADGKPIKGKDGKSIKETVFVKGKGRQVNAVVQSKPIESDSEAIKTLPHTYISQQSAINACKNHFAKLERGVATFSLTLAEGNAELIPELPVQVSGFKAEIDSNEWIISQVTHSLNKGGGFTTALEMELKPKEEKE